MNTYGYHANNSNRALQRSTQYRQFAREVFNLIPRRNTELLGIKDDISNQEQITIRNRKKIREKILFIASFGTAAAIAIYVVYMLLVI